MMFHSDRRNMLTDWSLTYAFGLPLSFFYRGSSWNLVTNSIGSTFRLGDRMSPIRSGGILPPRNRPCPECWETFVATKFPEECLQKIAKEAKEIVLWICSLIERLWYLCVLL